MHLTSVPRLGLARAGPGPPPTGFAAAAGFAASERGLDVRAVVVASDLGAVGRDELARLEEATGHVVHRVDPASGPAGSLATLVARVAHGTDLALLVVADTPTDPLPATALQALGTTVAACVDVDACAREGADPAEVLTRTRRALAALGLQGRRALALFAGASPLDAEAERDVDVVTFVRTGIQDRPLALPRTGLDALLGRAAAAPDVVAVDAPGRPCQRARVAVVLDECFDLYDEQGLAAFEAAGATLVPVSALDDDGLPADVDGLWIGDGRVERDSADLAARRGFRASVRHAVLGGMPTLATGGGFAYLTRGIRLGSGAFHPLAGALDAEALAPARSLPRGPVEVRTLVDTVLGPAGLRVRGTVDRGWVVRGLGTDERTVYETLRGPEDDGCGRQHLIGCHFRPSWPSCPDAPRAFVHRCAFRSAALERLAAR